MNKVSKFYSNLLITTRLKALVVISAIFLLWLIYLSAQTLFMEPEIHIKEIDKTSHKSHQITRIYIELDVIVSHERHQILRQTEKDSRNKISRINYAILEKQIIELGSLLLVKEEIDIYDNLLKNLSELKSIHLKINNLIFRDEQNLARKLNTKEFDPLLNDIRNDLFNLLNYGNEQRAHANQNLQKELALGFVWIVICAILFLISISLLIYGLSRDVLTTTSKAKQYLQTLVTGVFPESSLDENTNELGQLNNLIIRLNHYLQKIQHFLTQQLSEEYNSFKLQGEFDKIGISLNKLNKKHIHQEDHQQNQQNQSSYNEWIFKGIRRFNDILTQLAPNEKVLSERIIETLIDYLKVPIAGFYTTVSDNEMTYLRLDATYAYSKKKLYDQRIEVGEGLVGAAYLEKHMSIHTNIPDDYFLIASGMGHATPSRLLVLPLIHNDLVVGIIEIAGFSDFEEKKISLLQQIAPNIAVSLSTVIETAANTSLLLQNQKRIGSLLQNEQNNVDIIKKLKLETTEQEHKIEELQRYSTAIETNTIIIELNGNGQILSFNNKFERLTKFDNASLQKTKFINFIANPDEVTIISQGKPSRKHTQERILIYNKNRDIIPVIGSLTWSTIYHDRVFLIAIEITEFNNSFEQLKRITKSLKLEQKNILIQLNSAQEERDILKNNAIKQGLISESLSKVVAYANFDLNWNFIDWNDTFEREIATNYEPTKLYNFSSLVSEENSNIHKEIEQSLNQGIERKLMLEIDTSVLGKQWFQLNFLPVFNSLNKIEQYFVRFQNINFWKHNEILIEDQARKLSKQNELIKRIETELAEAKNTSISQTDFKKLELSFQVELDKRTLINEELEKTYQSALERANNELSENQLEIQQLQTRLTNLSSDLKLQEDIIKERDEIFKQVELLNNERNMLEQKIEEVTVELSKQSKLHDNQSDINSTKIQVWLNQIKSNLNQ